MIRRIFNFCIKDYLSVVGFYEYLTSLLGPDEMRLH